MGIKTKITMKVIGNVFNEMKDAAPNLINQVTDVTPKLLDQLKTPIIKSKKETKDNKKKEGSENNIKPETTVVNCEHVDNSNQNLKEFKMPQNVWQTIGCSQKTIDFIMVALSDGIIDNQDKEMLYQLIQQDNVNFQEFDFMLSKALEHYHKMAKNVIKELSQAFDLAEKMAEKEAKPNSEELTQALPGLLSMSSNLNPYALASSVSIDVLGKAIGKFVKEPSKLNRFKAEIIRIIDIPLMPEVLTDFFSYASSQIIEETQKNESNGLFKRWSESLFGKDIDLVPIWTEKLNHMMDKALVRYGNQPQIMSLFSKWRDSPLKQLMNLQSYDSIMVFPIPIYTTDFIEVMQYSFQKSQDSSNSLSGAFCILCNRLQQGGLELGRTYPDVGRVLDECRIRPVQELIANSLNKDYISTFSVPEKLDDLLEVLQYLKSRDDLKQLYRHVYKHGIRLYEADQNALNEIKIFKPKNILGF